MQKHESSQVSAATPSMPASPDDKNGKAKKGGFYGKSHVPIFQRRRHQWILALALLAILTVVYFQPSSSRDTAGSRRPHSNEQKNHNPIRQISILGERNSGTRWTYSHVSSCFNYSIHVTKRFTRYKHWFQYDDPTKYPHDTLVLAQFRNPYDWLKAMEHVPHHSPAHLRTALDSNTSAAAAQNDWQTFLTKPWTMPRFGKDLELKGDEVCQDNFLYRDIVSCLLEPLPESAYNHTIRYSEHQPFYEMRNDASGLPYDNIMELRADKIRNFVDVRHYTGVADVWVIQYEYLLAKGTQHLVDRIAEWTGVTPQCEAIPAQSRQQRRSRALSTDFAAFVREHVNWTAEALIGYEPEPSLETVQDW